MAAALTNLVFRYMRERVGRGELVPETARQYESRLLSFANATDTLPGDVTRRHVLAWMERSELSPLYRRARFTTLKGFMEWCVLNGHMRRDPTLGIKPPKAPTLLPRYLSADEMTAILSCCPTVRVRLATLLMVQECLRRGEVARLQIGDIDLGKKVLSVRGKGGRGGVTRRVPLSDETLPTLREYLRIIGHSRGPLFRSERWPERPISGPWIGELVTRAMEGAEVKQFPNDGRSPHAMRHTGAQDMADNGVDMRAIQAALGHASIKTTELYVRGDVKGLREAMAGRSYT